MPGYIIKRLFWFIPTLFIVTLFGFLLLVNSPGDPLDLLVSPLSANRGGNVDIEAQKTFWRKQLSLDLPLFYFSVTQLSEPDTLYKIYDTKKLKAYKTLLGRSGNFKSVNHYFNSVNKSRQYYFTWVEHTASNDTASLFYKHKEYLNLIRVNLKALETATDTVQQRFILSAIKKNESFFPGNIPDLVSDIEQSIKQLQSQKTLYKNYIPKLVWYGSNNRYRYWLFGGQGSKGVIRGDFGISYIKKEPVTAILKDKMIWSLFFSILSIILAYIISIPIGIHLANKPNSAGSRLTQTFMFMLYSMPSFFTGILLLMLFANPDVLSLFPPSGIKPIGGYDEGTALFQKLYESLPYIILPLICYTYSSLAFISKLTQTSISEQLDLDYIKTAKAKGLNDKAIIWKHALKNSLLPLITVFSTVFPSIIGGSVIIESIFTIPGMGLETIKAIIAKDYPIVIAVVTLSSILTMLSYLIADLLYAWVDPRIRYK